MLARLYPQYRERNIILSGDTMGRLSWRGISSRSTPDFPRVGPSLARSIETDGTSYMTQRAFSA
jgi:hypothetical protein